MISDVLVREINNFLAPEVVTAVKPIPSDVAIPDSTEKYRLSTDQRNLFLAVSSDLSPQLVKRGVERQRQAAAYLSGYASEPIELPISVGLTAEKSYAIWPWRQAVSTNRIRSKIERTIIAPKIYRWLRNVASQHAHAESPSLFVRNLERLQKVRGMPSLIAIAADRAAKAFGAGDIPPVHAFQHGDLWFGNILKAPSTAGFTIIDWPGARIDGMPFFDLVNFSHSTGAFKSTLKREIFAHCVLIGCNSRHSYAYVLSGLGALHFELEYFAENRLVKMCENMFQTIQAAINS